MRISVEPQVLIKSGEQIEAHCSNYETSYRSLYRAIDELQAGWQGKDHMAYVTQIRGFEPDFANMVRLLRSYAHFMISSGRAYVDLQEDRVAKARTLTN